MKYLLIAYMPYGRDRWDRECWGSGHEIHRHLERIELVRLIADYQAKSEVDSGYWEVFIFPDVWEDNVKEWEICLAIKDEAEELSGAVKERMLSNREKKKKSLEEEKKKERKEMELAELARLKKLYESEEKEKP